MLAIATASLGIVLAQIAPGPNMMAVAAASLGSGRTSGLATAAGVATGVICWSILFALGIGAVLRAFPQTLVAMRFIGGGYLLFLSLRALRTAAQPSGRDQPKMAGAAMRPRAAWRRGLLVVMTNPKAALMWIAVTMFLASSGLSPAEFVLIGAGASLSAMTIYGGYAVLFSTGAAVRTYRRFFRAIEGAFGIVFGVAGAKLVFDGVRSLRG